MEKNVCRLCGKTRNVSNMINLSSELFLVINYHCRLDLEDSKDFPQKICFDCNYAVVNFSDFCETAKEVQLKFQMQLSLDDVKVEIEELPVIECLLPEPESEPDDVTDERRNLRSSELPVAIEFENDANEDPDSGSDWLQSDSSDSDYKSSAATQKRKAGRSKSESKPKRPKYPRRSQTQKMKDNETVELDVSDSEKLEGGEISPEAMLRFAGELWCDMILSCSECDYSCMGPFELKQHYADTHSEAGKYSCEDCGDSEEAIIDTFHRFLNHIGETHKKFLRFCCFVCSKMFWNLDALHQHYESSHKNVQAYNCLICARYFKTSFYLTSHLTRFHKMQIRKEDGEVVIPSQAVHTVESLFSEELAHDDIIERQNVMKIPDQCKNPDGTITEEGRLLFASRPTWKNLSMSCNECSEEFPSAFSLTEHHNKQHPNTKSKNLVCSGCPERKTFYCLEAYVNHTFTIHHEHLRYQCFVCCEFFWNYKAIYNHFKSTHEYRALICLNCGKYHKSGYDLKQHKEIHLKPPKSNEPGLLKCSQCPKTYNRKFQLQRHLDTHKYEKSWICETCGVAFRSKSSLTNHYAVHQTEKPFTCDICGEAFKNKYKLKHHRDIHTGERKWSCEICGQRFRAKGTLKGHLMTHTGEKPWKCEHCEKAFAAKYDLMVHTRLHTGEFTHECNICGERYPSWSNYSKHMRGRHQVDPRSEKKKKYDALHKTVPMDSKAGAGSNSIQSPTL